MSIDAELKDVQKKLDDIEKKQEMMNKMYQLDGEKKINRGEIPSGHGSDHRQYILDTAAIIKVVRKKYG